MGRFQGQNMFSTGTGVRTPKNQGKGTVGARILMTLLHRFLLEHFGQLRSRSIKQKQSTSFEFFRFETLKGRKNTAVC